MQAAVKIDELRSGPCQREGMGWSGRVKGMSGIAQLKKKMGMGFVSMRPERRREGKSRGMGAVRTFERLPVWRPSPTLISQLVSSEKGEIGLRSLPFVVMLADVGGVLSFFTACAGR